MSVFKVMIVSNGVCAEIPLCLNCVQHIFRIHVVKPFFNHNLVPSLQMFIIVFPAWGTLQMTHSYISVITDFHLI